MLFPPNRFLMRFEKGRSKLLCSRPINFLLLPGFMNDESLWDGIRFRLEAVGTMIFADLSQGGEISEMADEVLKTAPPRFTLIGFSMGGYVAREIARMAPERVERLVLIATSARADTALQQERKAASAKQVRQSGFHGLSRSAIAASLSLKNAEDSALIEKITVMGRRLGEATFLQQAGQGRKSDLDRLHSINCPTLIIAGIDDSLRTVDEAEELHAGIAGSKLAVLNGTGHMIPLEVPDALTAAIIDWLGQ